MSVGEPPASSYPPGLTCVRFPTMSLHHRNARRCVLPGCVTRFNRSVERSSWDANRGATRSAFRRPFAIPLTRMLARTSLFLVLSTMAEIVRPEQASDQE